MANSIVITLPHRLGAEEARKRIAARIDLMRRDYIDKLGSSEATWNGNTADLRVVVLGQTVAGKIFVMDESVRIEVQLPWVLAALTGKIQGVLQSNAEDSLRIGHTPRKS